jgi:hypothetical protein
MLPLKARLGKGVYTRFYLTTSKGVPPTKLLHFLWIKRKLSPLKESREI